MKTIEETIHYLEQSIYDLNRKIDSLDLESQTHMCLDVNLNDYIIDYRRNLIRRRRELRSILNYITR